MSLKRSALLALRSDLPLLIHSDLWKKSPFTDRLLLNQLKLNPLAEIACPLRYSRDFPQQSVFTFFPETENIPAEYIKNPISYRNSFKSKKIADFSEDYCLIRQDLLQKFLDSKFDDSPFGLKSLAQNIQSRIYVSLDTLLFT